MKKLLVAAVAALAIVVAFGACAKSSAPLVSPAASAAPAATAPATGTADPHAGIPDPHVASKVLVPAGVGHKGTVLDVLQAGEYTYIQVSENGKQLWVATVGAKAAKGDVIEFADSPIFPSFQSKALNRSFDNLMMVNGIRNDTQK